MLQERISYDKGKKKGKDELDKAQLESFLDISRDPGVSLGDLLSHIKKGDWGRFLVSDNYKIILSSKLHDEITKRTGIDREDCFIPGGAFKIDPSTGKIDFRYNLSYDIAKIEGIREAAENKIKRYLKSQGLEIK